MSFYCFWLSQRLRNRRKGTSTFPRISVKLLRQKLLLYVCVVRFSIRIYNTVFLCLLGFALSNFPDNFLPASALKNRPKEQCKIMWKLFNKNLYRVIENFSLFVKPYGGVITEYSLFASSTFAFCPRYLLPEKVLNNWEILLQISSVSTGIFHPELQHINQERWNSKNCFLLFVFPPIISYSFF